MEQMPATPSKVPVTRNGWIVQIGFAAIVLAYFVWFVGPGLSGRFDNDDPWNIYYYWSRGTGELIRNLFLFFSTYFRPMGGVYFASLYHFFGVSPFPYHVVTTALLLLNTFLAYRFGRQITGSQLAGGLTALATTYHARMAQTVYLPTFVFDVLCFTFYFLALTYYLSIRARGVLPTWKQTIAFLLLYVCALDSKEMAVTLPVIVLLYEVIWHAPAGITVASALKWLKHEALPSLIGGALTAVYILGKAFGPGSLMTDEEWRPVFTWSRYWGSTSRFVNIILYPKNMEHGFFQRGSILALAAMLLFIAWRSRRKDLLLMWCFLWITPLPITFLAYKEGGRLCIPLVGWMVFLICISLWLCRAVIKLPGLKLIPTRLALGVLVVAGIAAYWAIMEHANRFVLPGIRDPGKLTEEMFRQVREVQPSVKPGSKIYVLKNPFANWSMKFIFELTYHDRSVNVRLAEKQPLPPAEVEQMDYIFTYEDGRLKRLKGP
jgi:hypothetical protein